MTNCESSRVLKDWEKPSERGLFARSTRRKAPRISSRGPSLDTE